MPIVAEVVDGGLTRIVWNTKIHQNVDYHASEKVRIDRFHPFTSHIVTCYLFSEPAKSRKSSYKTHLCLSWPKTLTTSGEGADLNNLHRPCTIWANFDGNDKFQLKENAEKHQWRSDMVILTASSSNRKSRLLQAENPKPITCQFWIEFETFTRSEKNALKHLTNLFERQLNCDVQFCFDGDTQIGSHTSILAARSRVFAAMFQVDMQESKAGNVRIQDVHRDTFEQLLYYIYSGRMLESLNEDTAQLLFAAADKYDIEDLKEDCVAFLTSCIRIDNVLNLMALAHLHSIEKLKEATLYFATQHGQEVCQLDDWEKWIKNFPDLCLLLTRRTMKSCPIV